MSPHHHGSPDYGPEQFDCPCYWCGAVYIDTNEGPGFCSEDCEDFYFYADRMEAMMALQAATAQAAAGLRQMASKALELVAWRP